MVSTTTEIDHAGGDACVMPSVDKVAVDGQVTTVSNEDFEKATKTFQLGKKNLFLNKFDESVANIEDACQVYASKFGEFDPACAEVYFFYGRALLELARVENTVLGNALAGVPEDNEPINDSRYGNPDEVPADEKQEISDKVISALCDKDEAEVEKKEDDAVPMTTTETPVATEIAASATPATETTVDETKPIEGSETTKETEAAIAAAVVEGDEEEDEDDEEEGDDTEEKTDEQVKDDAEAEEISNLQRAWEMFELAKLIYQKNFDNDPSFKHKRIAECLLKLGEISIEQEIYEQACTDLGESIKLQESVAAESRDDRMLAESFYQLALAQQFGNMFTEASESYNKAVNIMKLRIEKLQGMLAAKTGTDDDSELERNTMRDEIKELESLIPDMLCKLEEITEQGQQSIKLAKEMLLGEVSTPATNGDVKDITNMLKSKRKVSSSSLDGTTKKAKSDVTAETPIVTEPTTNGAAETTTEPAPVVDQVMTEAVTAPMAESTPMPVDTTMPVA